MTAYDLSWLGPYRIPGPGEPAAFNPPPESGVYLWVCGPPQARVVSYIGESGNLRKRFYNHLFYQLGGAYCIYEEDCLRTGSDLAIAYTPGFDNLIGQFLLDPTQFAAKAVANLRLYEFYWALVPKPKPERQAIESALITYASSVCGKRLQNSRPSISARYCRLVTVDSRFAPGSSLPEGIAPTCTFGTLPLDTPNDA